MSDWNPGPPTEAFGAPPLRPHVIHAPRPWYRQVRFMLPIGTVSGLILGAAAASAGTPSQAQTGAPAASVRTVTSTTTSPAAPAATVTRTTKATVTKTATPAPVRAVLKAWTEAGPQPDQQAAAMAQLKRQWPTLAKALEAATGVKAPAAAAVTQPSAAEPPAPADVYYANCSEARAAGDTPLYTGDPGYRSALDRDGDGVACE